MAFCQEDMRSAAAEGSLCLNAFTDLETCVGQLTCTQYNEYLSYVPSDPEPYPCKIEDQAVDNNCSWW